MWFPRPVYEALPYVYSIIGGALLLAAFFIESGPRGLLLIFGTVGMTGGLVLWMRRKDYRASHDSYDRRSIDD